MTLIDTAFVLLMVGLSALIVGGVILLVDRFLND